MYAMNCDHCGRPIKSTSGSHNGHGPIESVWVSHGSYGCDTGCCGHTVYAADKAGNIIHEEFDFDHPWDIDHDLFVLEHVTELKLPTHKIDWSRIDLSED